MCASKARYQDEVHIEPTEDSEDKTKGDDQVHEDIQTKAEHGIMENFQAKGVYQKHHQVEEVVQVMDDYQAMGDYRSSRCSRQRRITMPKRIYTRRAGAAPQ